LQRFDWATASLSPSRMRFGEFRSLIGAAVYAFCALGRPMAFLFMGLRALATMTRTNLHPNSFTTLAPSVWTELVKAREFIYTNHPVRPSNGEASSILFTDACLEGIGAVTIATGSGHIRHMSAAIPEHRKGQHICMLEAVAVLIALKTFRLRGICALFVDNTSVEGALRARYSPSPALNAIVTDICNLPVELLVARVSTEVNPADSLSRGGQLHVPSLLTLLPTLRIG